MERKDLELIQELMQELQDQMQFSEDDLSERLGRKKPEVEVLKVESKELPDDLMEDEEDIEQDMFKDEESEEDSLKRRLMKLRE